MSKIVFFCKDSKSNINLFEYYTQDIDALKDLGHEVVIVNRFIDIPFKFDVLFVWWWTYAFYPVILAKILRKPVIITGTFNFKFPDGFDGIDYFARPFWQRILIKFSVKSASLNLFVNNHELVNCTNYFKLKSSKYFPHIISADYLKEPNFENKKLELFNIAWSGKKNLIRKGVPELLEAIYILKKEGREIKLTLAGKRGDGIDYLHSLIKRYDINSLVTIVGEITKEEKISMMNSFAIFVQPSHYEGFGLAMAEAMGCGACIITCDVGAVKDVVGETGLYTVPGSPRDLADKIKIAIEDEQLRIKLQKMAFDRANNVFSYKKKLYSLDSFLNKLK
ncbi:glycosyltransferase family 4 protein [Chryseobacterium scophthalmum]|uniref:Glycosyltransferase involved in cell wall bisynthesis n=1 Tax=Chryseobacterium scophthalmum TaxID=59733 RepID=A0A1N6I936_9FLAO|nr:glycosyltransferase family 4 protein [Chryseobacterium scophthalmum]SIO28489.1 Glycosyltransferase involved in cell wall bisynthesis [Chryseobacterium scophthalmum]